MFRQVSSRSSTLLSVARRVGWQATTRKSSATSTGGKQFKSAQERHEYMKEANAKMEEYHKAREAMKHGKLKSKNPYHKDDSGTATAQFAIAGLFLVAFLSTPFIGRKIADDDEFREKWIPSWYNFTIKKERGWTRDEINEQMMQVELDVRRRALAGEFSPEKLEKLKKRLEASNNLDEDEDLIEAVQKAKKGSESFEELRHRAWEQPNPAMEKGEKYNEA